MNKINSVISGLHFVLFFFLSSLHFVTTNIYLLPSMLPATEIQWGVAESQSPACRSLVKKMNITKIHNDLNNKSSTHNSLMKPVVATLGYNGIVPFYPPKSHCSWVPLLPEKTHSSCLPRQERYLSLWLNSGFQCGV